METPTNIPNNESQKKVAEREAFLAKTGESAKQFWDKHEAKMKEIPGSADNETHEGRTANAKAREELSESLLGIEETGATVEQMLDAVDRNQPREFDLEKSKPEKIGKAEKPTDRRTTIGFASSRPEHSSTQLKSVDQLQVGKRYRLRDEAEREGKKAFKDIEIECAPYFRTGEYWVRIKNINTGNVWEESCAEMGLCPYAGAHEGAEVWNPTNWTEPLSGIGEEKN